MLVQFQGAQVIISSTIALQSPHYTLQWSVRGPTTGPNASNGIKMIPRGYRATYMKSRAD